MNPIERLEMHCVAMEQKYGLLYPLRLNENELKLNNKLIQERDVYVSKLRAAEEIERMRQERIQAIKNGEDD